jgi:hypothetical protein
MTSTRDGFQSFDHGIWFRKDSGIAGRVRFLCEEAALNIAGTTRRRSVDCLAVAGLGGFSTDVLLDAVVLHQADEMPLWVVELACWATGFLRSPTVQRLEKLGQAADRHLARAIAEQSPESAAAYVAVAHAALWAIGDAGGLEPEGHQAASTGIVAEVLKHALEVDPDDETVAPVRWAAAYTHRYCLPNVPLPRLVSKRDVVLDAYDELKLAFAGAAPT